MASTYKSGKGNKLRFLSWTIVALCSLGVAEAAVSFRGTATLPSLSLKIPIMAGSEVVPPPPPKTYTYKFTRGAETWQEDRFDIHELWLGAQLAATWEHPAGLRVTLGVVNSILPAAEAERHITMEHFERLSETAAAKIERIDSALLERWMADFSGQAVYSPTSVPINRSRLAAVLEYPTSDPELFAYTFRFNPRRAGQAHVPDIWFGLLVYNPRGEPPEETRKTIVQQLLGGIEATGRFENRSSSRFSNEPDPTEFRSHPSREAARRGIMHLPNWKAYDSYDYILLSNHRDAPKFAPVILETLQTAHPLFMALVPPVSEEVDDVSVVRVFAADSEFKNYVGPENEWAAGLFDPMRRELIIRPSSISGHGRSLQAALRVAIHEAFHQYLFKATGRAQASAWFNEGHASFFEAAEIGSRRITVPENSERVGTLEKMVADKNFSLMPVLQMSYPQFYSGTAIQRSANYSLAWGLAYYLQRGAPLVRNKPYAYILGAYMLALAETGDSAVATAAAFDGVDMRSFERAFVEFWKSSGLRSKARRAPLAPMVGL